MKNKALTTLMATALTASMVLPGTTASAALNDLSVNQSNYSTVQTTEKVASTEEVIPSGEVSLTITSFSNNTVRTSKGQLTVSKSLKPIFQTANRQALTNAKATVIVKNGQMTDIKALTLSKMGTSKKPVVFDGDDAKISGNVTVTGDYNKVQNLTISKELIVTARVKKAITIENVSVGDTITFQPLRLKKINWLNVTLKDILTPDINVQRNKIMLDSDKLISNIQVTDDVPFLEVDADVGKLLIDVKKDFSLSGEGKIEQATVKGGNNVALDSSHHFNKVQVDDKNAKVTYAVVDKTALKALIASIQYVPVNNNEYYNGYNNGYYNGYNNGYNTYTSEKWTTQADRTIFDTAVASAQAVANDTRATKEQVTNAITQLNNAFAIYKNAQQSYAGDKNTLNTLINSVQSIYVTESWDGYGVSYNTPWTTPSERTALANAVSSAQNVVHNYNASQNEITNAIYNLNNAITTYKNSIRNNYYGNDKSTLTNAIINIQYATYISSNQGYDISPYYTWTTPEAKEALDSAISYAQSINDVSYAITYLNNAITIYYSQKKQGLGSYY